MVKKRFFEKGGMRIFKECFEQSFGRRCNVEILPLLALPKRLFK